MLVLPSEDLQVGRSGGSYTRHEALHKSSEAPKEHKINHSLIINQVKVSTQYNLFKTTGKRAIHFRQTSIPSV